MTSVVVDVNTRRAVWWVRAMRAVSYIVGEDRAGRWAVWGAYRFTRFRVRGQQWRGLNGAR